MRRGSRHPHIENDVFKIELLEKELNVVIYPIWSPRTDKNIVLADVGSKLLYSSDGWSTDDITFDDILSYFDIKVSMNGFSTLTNRKLQSFISKIPQLGCLTVNFFTHSF